MNTDISAPSLGGLKQGGLKDYKYDIVSIGDSTLDTFVVLENVKIIRENPTASVKGGRGKKMLVLPYADKVPVKDLDYALGGNACNVVIGTHRLGLNSTIYTILGDDDTGKKILNELEKQKIDISHVKVEKKGKTNNSVVIKYKGDRTILGFHAERKYKLDKFASSKFVYLTSMSSGCENIYPALIKYVKKSKSKLCFGPGTYQRRSGLDNLKEILENTYLYISNKEEGKDIFKVRSKAGEKNHDLVKRILNKIILSGVKIAVITDGRQGAWVSDGEKVWYLQTIKEIKPKYPTGAGDAFSSGFISALFYEKDIKQALMWGMFNASGVIQEPGAGNGILNKKEMEKYFVEYEEYQPKEI